MELGKVGHDGPIVDMVRHGQTLYVVLEHDALIAIDIIDPDNPVVDQRWEVDDLVVAPRWVGLVNDTLYVSGDNGIVRLEDGRTFLVDQGGVGTVVDSTEGPVAPIGRRIFRLSDGEYVGAATRLVRLPEEGSGEAKIAFSLQGDQGASVGLMDGQFSELDSSVVRGMLRNLMVHHGRLWAINDIEMVTWPIIDGRLGEPVFIPIKGARDVDSLTDNYYVVSGSFGRAVYRLIEDGQGPGDVFFNATRQPSRLTSFITDQRRILGFSDEGAWLYSMGGRAELTDAKPPSTESPPVTAATTWGSASFSGDRRQLEIQWADTETELPAPTPLRIPYGGLAWTVVAVDGAFWVGHDEGIMVIELSQEGVPVVKESFRLDGPVRGIIPRQLGRGGSYVAEFGGFGEIQPVEIVTPEQDEDEPKQAKASG